MKLQFNILVSLFTHNQSANTEMAEEIGKETKKEKKDGFRKEAIEDRERWGK